MIARTPRPPGNRAPSIGWMITLTDLGFLVLAFFVVQFAMVSPRPAAWLEVRESLSRELAPTLDPETTGPTADLTAPLRDAPFGLDTAYLRARLGDVVMPALEPFGATLDETAEGVVIGLPAGALADSRLSGALATAGDALRFIDNRVAVVGIAVPASGAPADIARALAPALDAAAVLAASLLRDGAVPIAAQARFARVGEALPADGAVARVDILVRDRAGDDG